MAERETQSLSHLATRRIVAAVIAAGVVLAAGFATAARPNEADELAAHEACDGGAHEVAGVATRKKGRFEALPDVSLSGKVEDKLNAMAERFQKKTGKTFVVTSGTRDPESQAQLIYAKLAAGDDLLKLYRDKSAITELMRVFDDAREAKKSKAATVALIAGAIKAQMKRGIYISAHLRAGAADVRSTTMTPNERRIFAEIAREHGLSVMLEASPPHFHLQLE